MDVLIHTLLLWTCVSEMIHVKSYIRRGNLPAPYARSDVVWYARQVPPPHWRTLFPFIRCANVTIYGADHQSSLLQRLTAGRRQLSAVKRCHEPRSIQWVVKQCLVIMAACFNTLFTRLWLKAPRQALTLARRKNKIRTNDPITCSVFNFTVCAQIAGWGTRMCGGASWSLVTQQTHLIDQSTHQYTTNMNRWCIAPPPAAPIQSSAGIHLRLAVIGSLHRALKPTIRKRYLCCNWL